MAAMFVDLVVLWDPFWNKAMADILFVNAGPVEPNQCDMNA